MEQDICCGSTAIRKPIKRKEKIKINKAAISTIKCNKRKRKSILHKSHKKLTKKEKQQIFDVLFQRSTVEEFKVRDEILSKIEVKSLHYNKSQADVNFKFIRKQNDNGWSIDNRRFKQLTFESQGKNKSKKPSNVPVIKKESKAIMNKSDNLGKKNTLVHHENQAERNKNEALFRSNVKNVKQNKQQLNLISLTGFNRITDSSYFVRLIWIAAYLLCLGASLYQCGKCIFIYIDAEPARKVEFDSYSEVRVPVIVTCPTLLLNRNPMTKALSQKYEEMYKMEPTRYSDLLQLPNVNMNTIWTMSEVNSKTLSTKITCSTLSKDVKCSENFELEDVLTSGGLCVALKNKGNWKTYGAVTSSSIKIDKPKLFGWNPFVMYMRVKCN